MPLRGTGTNGRELHPLWFGYLEVVTPVKTVPVADKPESIEVATI